MKTYLNITALLLLLVSVQCTPAKDKDNQHPQSETAHDHSEEEGTVTFTEEQMKTIGIQIGDMENKQLTSSLKANGILKVPNQNKATVNSLYSGVVQKILVEPGYRVSKGQVIATIANPEFIQVQSEYLNTLSQIRKAEQEVERQKMLYEGNAGALKNLQSAETEIRTLRNMKAMYDKQIRMMGIEPATVANGTMISEVAVRSPIAGTVSKIGVEMGTFVSTSALIAEVIDNSQLHLDLFVYEQDLAKLNDRQTIHFTLTNNPGREYDAQIFSMGNTFEDESKAVSIHARVLGDKTGLIDGMNVTAVVSLERATVKAVPNEAIVTDKGKDYIFVVTGGGNETHDHEDHDHTEDHKHDHGPEVIKGNYTFKKILIARGTSDVGYTEITVLGTLPEQAKIVTKGAFFVIAKMNDTGEHGHAH